MEFFAVIAVVVAICIILGVSMDILAMGALILLGVIVLAMALFFIGFLIVFLCSRRKSATFSRIAKREGSNFRSAFYIVDDQEYHCIFPAEPKFMYKNKKNCKVFFNKRFGFVFDGFAAATCIAGTFFSVASAASAAWFVITYL